MSTTVIEHVPVEELPAQWRRQVAAANGELVTVRIESEVSPRVSPPSANPMFGMWKARKDVADVDGFVRNARAARYPTDAPASE